jgi:hypothetical protein
MCKCAHERRHRERDPEKCTTRTCRRLTRGAWSLDRVAELVECPRPVLLQIRHLWLPLGLPLDCGRRRRRHRCCFLRSRRDVLSAPVLCVCARASGGYQFPCLPRTILGCKQWPGRGPDQTRSRTPCTGRHGEAVSSLPAYTALLSPAIPFAGARQPSPKLMQLARRTCLPLAPTRASTRPIKHMSLPCPRAAGANFKFSDPLLPLLLLSCSCPPSCRALS